MEKYYSIDSRRYKGLFFDFDGTLVDTESIQYDAFVQTLKEYKATYVSYPHHIKNYAGRGSRYIFTQEIQKQNINADIEKLLDKRIARYFSLVKEKGVQAIPGLLSLLKEAKKRGLKLAIVSGGHRANILSIMSHAGIPNVFDAIIGIEEVKAPKPDPDGFLKAIILCKVKAEKSVSFEDGISGIIAAKEAKIGKRFAISHSLDIIKAKKVDKKTIFIQDFREIHLT